MVVKWQRRRRGQLFQGRAPPFGGRNADAPQEDRGREGREEEGARRRWWRWRRVDFVAVQVLKEKKEKEREREGEKLK